MFFLCSLSISRFVFVSLFVYISVTVLNSMQVSLIASLRVLRSYPSFPLFDRRINNARTRVLKQQALNNGLASMDDFLLGQAWDEKYGSYIDGALKGQVPPDNLKWHPDLLPANM